MRQDMTVMDWNPAAGRIFGFSREEMLGQRPFGRIIPATSRAAVEQFVTELVAGNETRSTLNQNLTKDGRTIICEWHDTPLRDETGSVMGVLAMVQDMTEKLRAEAAARELSGRLLAAQDKERRRIARELHDTTAQTVAALCMNLTMLEPRLRASDKEAHHVLADAVALGERASQEIRTVSYLLHPPILEHVGLAGAIREFATGFSRRSGIRVVVEIGDGVARFSPEIELALLRIVQESLGNVHRHSGSSTATIRLHSAGGQITLEVLDSGTGFRVPHPGEGEESQIGVGIAGMRERLRLLGGRLEILSGPGGATIRASLPFAGTLKTDTD
jgi:PAS domain S-box-containing protein